MDDMLVVLYIYNLLLWPVDRRITYLDVVILRERQIKVPHARVLLHMRRFDVAHPLDRGSPITFVQSCG